jgi:tetratricopeptide (TPR) repeat protein
VEPTAESDPQAWPALADAHRRAGRLDEARKVAEHGLEGSPDDLLGRVALALTLLDEGQPDAARNTLAPVFADEVSAESEATPGGPFAAFAAVGATALSDPAHAPGADVEALAAIDELEVEDAFEAAEARTDEMHNANHLAEAALHAVESGAPEGVWTPETASPFATQTVADLLERQGHEETARDLREELLARGAHDGAAAYPDRQRTVATLERWLGNLRRAAS